MITELMSGLTVAVPVVAAVGVAGVLARGYVKAPPDKALIISGVRKKPKVLIGKAGVKIPFFERVDELSLKLIWTLELGMQCRQQTVSISTLILLLT